MIVRRRGMPLLRGALIGGAGYAAGRRAASGAQREAEQNAAIAELQAQKESASRPPAPAKEPADTPGDEDLADRLVRLGEMVEKGLLSQAEFAAAKMKLLGM